MSTTWDETALGAESGFIGLTRPLNSGAVLRKNQLTMLWGIRPFGSIVVIEKLDSVGDIAKTDVEAGADEIQTHIMSNLLVRTIESAFDVEQTVLNPNLDIVRPEVRFVWFTNIPLPECMPL